MKHCLVALLIFFTLKGNYDSFVEAHLVPDHLEKILDQHIDELKDIIKRCRERRFCSSKKGVHEFGWLSGYLVKYETCRIKGAEYLEGLIEEYNLDHIRVPKKYFYHLKGRPFELHNSNYLVIAEKVEFAKSHPEKSIPRSHMEQLLILIEKSEFRDHHARNVAMAVDGRLAIIDTGDESFWSDWGGHKRGAMNDGDFFQSIFFLISKGGLFIKKGMLSKGAYDCVVEKLAQIFKKQRNTVWYAERIQEHIEYVNSIKRPDWDYLSAFRKNGLMNDKQIIE